jgi:dihydrofolate synthase/folylpolyglutamate synthase
VPSLHSPPPRAHARFTTVDAALSWLDSLQASGIRPGLARMRRLLAPLGAPHRKVRAIIVAGTNGKGSTSATLASILKESGYRTGLYTSPHLVELRERWTVDGEMVGEEALLHAIDRLHGAAGRAAITPTYFEALTLLAFIAFAEAACEASVLEVGMGGRLDATNVVRPIAALITPIGLDHTEFLGNTLRRVAAEKAGVIHRGAIVLTSNDDPVVLDVLCRRAERFDAPLHVVTGEHDTPLAGAFQRRNAMLAASAAEALRGTLPRITPQSIERGIAATVWRGRLEHLVAGGKDVWIDGGHNAHAVREIAPFIEANVPPPRTLVFGIMRDKAIEEVSSRLFPLFRRVIATDPYPPRAASPEELAAIARRMGIGGEAIAEPRRALERALASGEKSVVVAGSLYLAGAAIAHFDAQRQQQRDDQQ